MPKLKICGLKSPRDIQYVNQYSPDFIGFVFAKSPRQVTPQEAKELRRRLNPGIVPVGVFVNEKTERIVELVREGTIEMVQLHGDEPIEYLWQLKEKFEEINRKEGSSLYPKIIKAVRAASRQAVEEALAYPADFLLFDTYVRGQYGGSGECFNWQLLEGVERPFFLAGGLNTENIARAARKVKPFCLDVSSGAETEGKKDGEKIRRLVETIVSMKKAE